MKASKITITVTPLGWVIIALALAERRWRRHTRRKGAMR